MVGRTFASDLSLPDDRRFYNVFFLLERSDTVDVYEFTVRQDAAAARRAASGGTLGSMDPLDEPEP